MKRILLAATTLLRPPLACAQAPGLLPVGKASESTALDPNGNALGTGFAFRDGGVLAHLPGGGFSYTEDGTTVSLAMPLGSDGKRQLFIGQGTGNNIPSGRLTLGTVSIGDGAGGGQGAGFAGQEDTFVGQSAGAGITTGSYDTIGGLTAGGALTTDSNDTLWGNDCMRDSHGSGNTGIGNGCMRDGTFDENTVSGTGALSSFGDGTVNASYNDVSGYETMGGDGASGGTLKTASYNNVHGALAGQYITTGIGNDIGGYEAARNASSMNGSVIHGYQADQNGNAAYSVILGFQAAQEATGPTINVIGSGAGASLTTEQDVTLIGPNVDTPQRGLSHIGSIGGMIYYNRSSTAAPAVSRCGLSPGIDAHANNRSGTVTVGTGLPKSCAMTFAGAGYAAWSHCRVTAQAGGAGFGYSYTLTGIVFTLPSGLVGKVDYDCDGV